MQHVQGAIIAGALTEIVIGASGLIGKLLKFVGPITIAPTVSERQMEKTSGTFCSATRVSKIVAAHTVSPTASSAPAAAGHYGPAGAAKAEDELLIVLSGECATFVSWLDADEPLVRAYAACILANIAFLEAGQKQVLDAQGVAPLVRLLKTKDNKKVTLHSTAAVQNITYKNAECCHASAVAAHARGIL